VIPVDVKMALVNYKQFHSAIVKIEDDIEAVNAKRFKIGGSVVKIPETTKPRDLVIIENLERLDKLRNSLSVHHYLAELADEFINALNDPFKSMVVDKYINKLNATQLEEKYCYSFRQISNIIDRLIERFIEIT